MIIVSYQVLGTAPRRPTQFHAAMNTMTDLSDPLPPPGNVAEAFDAFLSADEVADTEKAFANLLTAAACEKLRGGGLPLYNALKAAVAPSLNFRTGKIFTQLDAKIAAAQALATKMGPAPAEPFKVLVCGAGPVGLRGVEAAMLGLDALVIEKRTSFSARISSHFGTRRWPTCFPRREDLSAQFAIHWQSEAHWHGDAADPVEGFDAAWRQRALRHVDYWLGQGE